MWRGLQERGSLPKTVSCVRAAPSLTSHEGSPTRSTQPSARGGHRAECCESRVRQGLVLPSSAALPSVGSSSYPADCANHPFALVPGLARQRLRGSSLGPSFKGLAGEETWNKAENRRTECWPWAPPPPCPELAPGSALPAALPSFTSLPTCSKTLPGHLHGGHAGRTSISQKVLELFLQSTGPNFDLAFICLRVPEL